MQDYRAQAKKNCVVLLEAGPCQFCGAAVSRGVDECLRLFAETQGREFSDPLKMKVHLFSVDAHALQHSEIHGKLNNHGHLLRLYMMLKRNASTTLHGQEHRFMDYLLATPDRWVPLSPPPLKQRGAITVKDLWKTKSASEHQRMAQAWGQSVFDAWHRYGDWAAETYELLQEELGDN